MCNYCLSVLVPENKGDFQSTLLKYIDAEELPAFLGGKKTDPDGNPRCETIVGILFLFFFSSFGTRTWFVCLVCLLLLFCVLFVFSSCQIEDFQRN